MLVHLDQFFLEIESVELIILGILQVLVVSQTIVVTTVVLKHVAKGLRALGVDLVELADEGQRSLEVSLE